MYEPDFRQPDPPGVQPVKPGSRPWLPLIVIVVVGILFAVAVYYPIPIFWRFVPGVVQDVEDLVEIEGATDYNSEGSLYLTTVSIDDSVTFADWVLDAFDDESVVVLKDDVTGGGSTEQLLEQARNDMRESKEAARDVAFTELNLLSPMAQVSRVVQGTPADGSLEVGDMLLAVNGLPTYTACQVQSEIVKSGVGQPVDLRIQRGKRDMTVELQTRALDEANPDYPIIGIQMEEKKGARAGLPRVSIDTGEIGGPSAGSMFALTIYDRLTPDDLTHGLQIAGTGSINCDGTVEPIGGVEQKVAAAEDQGAEIFLSPAGDFEAAQEAADDIEVVSVATFDDAVTYLEALS
jgi:PDZ domain-containing protein